MSTVPRRPRLTLLAAGCITMVAFAAPAGAAADVQPGSISGKVHGALPPRSKGVVLVRAINASTGAIADVATVHPRRTFRLAVDPGAYAVELTVARPGVSVRAKTIQVTVADGQRRSGLSFTVTGKASRAAARATTAPVARPAYVSTDGTEVAGVTAYSIEPFTGGTGDWKDVRSSLAAAIQAEASDATPCSGHSIASASERRAVQRLSFKTSRTVAKGTRVDRNLIVGDVSVGGRIRSRGRDAVVTVSFVNKRTGKTFDSVRATLRASRFTANARSLARVVAERLCRRPASYTAQLAIDGRADFSGHTATGRMDATLSATATGGTGGQASTTFTGKGPLAWSNLVFTSKKGCTFSNPVPAKGEWTATITNGDDGQLTVDWGPSGPLYFAASTATVTCPGSGPQSGQPGPSLVGILPNGTKLPSSGGTLPVTGNLGIADQSITNTGTLKITPVWKYRVP